MDRGILHFSRLAGQRLRGIIVLAIVLLLAFAPEAASAQTRAIRTARAPAKAVLVAPLTILKTQDMDFAKIAPRTAPGTVTINPNTQVCTKTGPILQIGSCKAAQFVGRGGKNLGARITLTSTTNLTGPGQTMVLDGVTLGSNSSIVFIGNVNGSGQGIGLTTGGGNQRYSIVSTSGIYTLNVGATLHVNANQAPGLYRGSITVQVQYQ
jgi:hypothetical protein